MDKINYEVIETKMLQELLRLRNEVWLEEDESPFAEQQIREDIQLQELGNDPLITRKALYKSENIFWGYTIVVELDENYQYLNTSIIE